MPTLDFALWCAACIWEDNGELDTAATSAHRAYRAGNYIHVSLLPHKLRCILECLSAWCLWTTVFLFVMAERVLCALAT